MAERSDGVRVRAARAEDLDALAGLVARSAPAVRISRDELEELLHHGYLLVLTRGHELSGAVHCDVAAGVNEVDLLVVDGARDVGALSARLLGIVRALGEAFGVHQLAMRDGAAAQLGRAVSSD